MHAWEQIQQTIEYVEEHLNEEIRIQELAELASLSPFYYQRLFRRLVRKPVGEYIKLRRLARATEELKDQNRRILDIALGLGFMSHEHFTRSFKETFGITPGEYRKHPESFNRMTVPQLELQYTLIEEGVPLVTEGIVLEINRKTLSEPVYFTGLEKKMPVQFIDGLGIESGTDPLDALWRRFHEDKTDSFGLTGEEEEIGVTLPSEEEGYFTYFAGAKVNADFMPNGHAAWTLLPGEYVVCTFEAENFEALVMDALYKAQQYLYHIWLPSHGLQTEPFCAERYAGHGAETTCMDIWLRLI